MQYIYKPDGQTVEVTKAGDQFLAYHVRDRPEPLTADALRADYAPVGGLGYLEQMDQAKRYIHKATGDAVTVYPVIDGEARERGSEFLIDFGNGLQRSVTRAQLLAECSPVDNQESSLPLLLRVRAPGSVPGANNRIRHQT